MYLRTSQFHSFSAETPGFLCSCIICITVYILCSKVTPPPVIATNMLTNNHLNTQELLSTSYVPLPPPISLSSYHPLFISLPPYISLYLHLSLFTFIYLSLLPSISLPPSMYLYFRISLLTFSYIS